MYDRDGNVDLAAGFGDSPIAKENIDFGDGDPIFYTAPATGSATQTVTATFDPSLVTKKFFKAAIEFPPSEAPDGEE